MNALNLEGRSLGLLRTNCPGSIFDIFSMHRAKTDSPKKSVQSAHV